jgi:S1-C subfamily serine protease
MDLFLKRVLLLMLIFILTPMVLPSCATSYSTSDTNPSFIPPENYNQDHQHEALIRLHDSDGKFFCSGFVISDQYAVTAGHCVDSDFGRLRQFIKIYNSVKMDTYVVASGAASNRRGDTGLIKGNFKEFDKLRLIIRPQDLYATISKAKKVYALGFPYGADYLISEINPKGLENFHMAGAGVLLPGMSGGPLVTEEGIVIGINSYVSGDHSAFSSLIGLLDSLEIKYEQ